jgi:hypothetical protein
MGPACNAGSPREDEEEALEQPLAFSEHEQELDGRTE